MLHVSQFHFVYYIQHCDNDGFGRLAVLSTEYNTHLNQCMFIMEVLIDYVTLGLFFLIFVYISLAEVVITPPPPVIL